MGAYGCQEDAGYGRVSKRSACGQRVCCTACRSAYDASVGLDDGEEVGVAVELEIRHVGRGAAVDYQFV